MVRSIGSLAVFFGLILTLGCGSSSPKPVAVSGTLKLDGKAIPGAIINFLPIGEGKPAFGTAKEDGSFTLTTNTPGDGALPGEYKVIIQQPAQGGESPYDEPGKAAPLKIIGPKIPDQYTRVDKTPFKQTVPTSGPVNLEMSSK